MKSNLITEEEKNRILNMHKKRSANHYLVEQLSSGDPTPDEYKDLIGKSAIFEFKKIIKVQTKGVSGDEWYEVPTNELGPEDKLVYDDVINNTIRGTISNVIGVNQGNYASVRLVLTNITAKLGIGFINDKDNVRYQCGRNFFKVDIDLSQSTTRRGDFFKDKVVSVGFTCPSLSDYLEKRLPCKGGFDFSKNDTNRLPDTDILPDTLS